MSRRIRRLNSYNDKYNEIFLFYLKSYRCKILNFCGTNVKTKFNKNGYNVKICFKLYENGELDIPYITKHPNILKAVIIGKKSWGLFKNEWSDGIVDGDFKYDDIINEFKKYNIIIPEKFLIDFKNTIYKKFNLKYIKNLK